MSKDPEHRRGPILAVGGLLVVLASPLFAVRPFITDDARVVGRRQAQMETWMRGDRHALQHWVLTSFGPIAPLEVTVGAVHGLTFGDATKYSVAGPLIQAKYLLRKPTPNSWPGIAISGGTFAPVGNGGFKLHGWDSFAYAAVTESLGEEDRILLHGNVGFVNSHSGRKATWGGGSQVRVRGGFHIVSEVFSGDPYAESSGIAFQAGFRHFFSAYIQIDATLGVWRVRTTTTVHVGNCGSETCDSSIRAGLVEAQEAEPLAEVIPERTTPEGPPHSKFDP